MDDAASIPTIARLKRYQRFGDIGPAYEVLGLGAKEGTVRVIVLESGEEFDYSLAHALDDPHADAPRF